MTSTAMGQRVDIEKLRAALRHMSRGNLLSIANRAIELVPQARLGSLVAATGPANEQRTLARTPE